MVRTEQSFAEIMSCLTHADKIILLDSSGKIKAGANLCLGACRTVPRVSNTTHSIIYL